MGNFVKGESTKMNLSQPCWLVSQLVIHSPLTGYVVRIVGPRPRVQFSVRFIRVEVNLQELT